MGIKKTPINYREYYASMKEHFKSLLEETKQQLKDISDKELVVYNKVKNNILFYKSNFDVDLFDYSEFKDNEYQTGKLHKLAKGLYINRDNNYELVSDLFDLYDLAIKQKTIHTYKKDIIKYNKILALSVKDYNELLRTFYTAVQKQLILKGRGYSLEGSLGWICINRCHIDRQRTMIDYAATKKRKKELLEKGIRLYNKEEAEFCKNNNIEYKAEDYRVFMKNEYCYQIPLIGCKLPNGSKYKLHISDYRATSIRSKSNEDLIKEANGDLNKILEYPADLRLKLNLCNKVDKMLYLNFIRNENQEPINIAKTSR